LQEFDQMPGSALLSAKELSSLINRSRASLWRDVQAGRLPKPIAIGPQARRWRVEDVRAYLNGDGAV
jgi:predicted DNA-binding transcriptional regulator AlpA